MIRRRVAGAVRIFLYALLLAALLAPQLSSPAFADEGEGKEICHFCDKLWDEDELCPTCGTCPECIAKNNVHDHVEWVRTFFRGEALFTDANHNYEFDPGTEPDNWHVSGNIGEPGCKASCEDLYGNIWTADWNYHTGWCYCDDCFSNPVKIFSKYSRQRCRPASS